MEKIEQILINTEYITLSQFLKLSNLIQSGGEAKLFLKNNIIRINNVEDSRRGRKLYKNDIVEINKKEFKIC